MTETFPLLLVPGLGSSARVYLNQLPALWAVSSVTIPNHVRDNTMSGVAKRILGEAPKRFALAGHSMGGYISLEIMRQAPERVVRLALMNTQARPESPEARERRLGWIANIQNGKFDASIDAFNATLVHPSRKSDKDIMAVLTAMAHDVGPDNFVRQLEAIMSRADSRPLLASVKCPTLVLTSDTDNTVPNEASFEMAKAIPGAKLVVIPDCGHMTQLEKPDAVTQALLDWMRM